LFAAFIAIAVAPAIWRRAGELTRKRMEASMPLTLNEVQADKDQQKAEFAIALRKLEMKSKSLQEKLTEQRAEAAVHKEKSLVLDAERQAQDAELAARAADIEGLKTDLGERDKTIEDLGTLRTDLEGKVAGLNTEVDSRDKLIADLQIDIDNRRIELVTKVAEQDQLNSRMRELNLTRKSLEEKLRLTAQEMREVRETSRVEAKRIADFERKTERLMSQLSDRDERLERREKELMRAKDNLKASTDEQNSIKRQLSALNQRNQELERAVAKGLEQNKRLEQKTIEKQAVPTIVKQPDMTETNMKKLAEDKARLMAMVQQLNREKSELVEKLKAATNANGARGNEDDRLRAQVMDLTAKVVTLTAESEGSKSPIARLLQTANADSTAKDITGQMADAEEGEQPESLANRIKALQKSARGG
jgi:chromosome segregation ATPase